MARRVAEVFCEHRIDMARSLDGTSPDEHRKRVYKTHQAGEFQVLSVCGLCREGYNDPGIAAVDAGGWCSDATTEQRHGSMAGCIAERTETTRCDARPWPRRRWSDSTW